MTRIRLGAVGYLNARPAVFGLDHTPQFDVRFDVPSKCAALLHAGATDLGLIPSIEFLRGGPYRIVPDVAIASDGPVASVALYTTKPIEEVRSIAMDTSSRTSVALTQVLCSRHFKIAPTVTHHRPDAEEMLAGCDAALIIGDAALLLDHKKVRPKADTASDRRVPLQPDIQKIDLGEVWKAMTGLPFVYAFWAGRPGVLAADDVAALQHARDEGERQPERVSREYFADAPEHVAVGARYLRDNIKYHLGAAERAGLEAFYRYAAEAGVVASAGRVEFY
jgi:chorismate dehydratase